VFETSIPEEIVIVKSVHGKRKCRKKAAEADADSDEEARQLIDEAENEQDSDTSPASAGMIIIHGAVTCSRFFCCLVLVPFCKLKL